MKRIKTIGSLNFFISHIMMLLLIKLIMTPGLRTVKSTGAFLGAVLIIECFYLYKLLRSVQIKKSVKAPSDIMVLLWGFLILWEWVTTKTNRMHPVLFPTPEDVFYVFPTQYEVLIENVLSSLELLILGIIVGIGLGTCLGVLVGWIPRLADLFYPIANVISPIPPVVYAPYIIILMPSFRSASAVIVIIGIFFPTFLRMILRMQSIEPEILDSAKVLQVNTFTMITKILFPYVLPEVIAGLRLTVTTSVTLLIFAEMMGATSGMGYYIVNYNNFANYTNVVAGFIVVGVVVTVLEWGVSVVQRHTVKWQPSK